jgi:uncharacterized repeat protein (TIGR01451 family)
VIDTALGQVTDRHPLDGPALGIDSCNVDFNVDPFGDLQPFGLGFNADDQLLVGVVCSGASTVSQTDFPVVDEIAPGNPAGDPSHLVGYVFSYVDGFNEVLSWSLEGDRGHNQENGRITHDAVWHPWGDVYPYDVQHDAVSYPQPAITDIAVDANGNLILAIGDRWGHQTAPLTDVPAWDGGNREISETIVSGDLQRACLVGEGIWSVEGSEGCPGGVGTDVEHYGDDNYGSHDETALGSVVQIPGRSYSIATHFNPLSEADTWRSGGLSWHQNETGSRAKGVRLYDGRSASPDDTFEKAAGIGDIAISCGRAPIQIGSRLWRDLDEDGLEDLNEPGIADVEVALYDVSDQMIALATSGADGNYMFSNDNVRGGLAHGAAYTAAVTAANYEPGAVFGLGGMYPGLTVTQIVDGNQHIDSDASVGVFETPFDGLPMVALVAGDDPATDELEPPANHSYGIGFRDQYDLALETTIDAVDLARGTITYTIWVRNQGSEPSGAFAIADRLPFGTSVLFSSREASEIDGRFVTWRVPVEEQLEPAESFLINLVLDLHDLGFRPFANTAEIKSDSGADDDSTPNSVGQEELLDTEGRPLQPFGLLIDVARAGREDDQDATAFDVYELGSMLWFDEDGSGIREANEQAVGEGVLIRLRDLEGEEVATTATDEDGRYVFSHLFEDDYVVEVASENFADGGPLEGMEPTIPFAGSVPALAPGVAPLGALNADNDSDGAALPDGSVRSGVVRMRPAAPTWETDVSPSSTDDDLSNLTIDFGFSRPPGFPIRKAVLAGSVAVVIGGTLIALIGARRRKRCQRRLDG